jgi:hypothetical protein
MRSTSRRWLRIRPRDSPFCRLPSFEGTALRAARQHRAPGLTARPAGEISIFDEIMREPSRDRKHALQSTTAGRRCELPCAGLPRLQRQHADRPARRRCHAAALGQRLRQSLERTLAGRPGARWSGQDATLFGCRQGEVVLTSRGSEANNLALKAVFFARPEAGDHIATSDVEPGCMPRARGRGRPGHLSSGRRHGTGRPRRRPVRADAVHHPREREARKQ